MAEDTAPQQDITELSEAEEQWIAERLAFARQDGVDHLDVDAVSAFSDRQLAAFRNEELSPEEGGVMADVTAVLLGEHLGAKLGLKWVIVQDAQGTDLGMRDTLSSAVIFPQSTVGKQWNEATTGWVPHYVEWLTAQLKDIRTQTPDSPTLQ